MPSRVVYMDNHATTRVDPRVIDVMLPYFAEAFGNAGSINHEYGWQAKEAVEAAREKIAAAVGARSREIVFTSGATESNNLAIKGVATRARRKGNHLIGVETEHKAVLDPLQRLGRRDYRVTLLAVEQAGSDRAGWLDPQKVSDAICDDTILVSVMLANNEIGVIQPLAEIGQICKQRGVLLHCDATQAVGKIPVDVEALDVDLLSFSAHKLYGPKGVGGLYVRRQNPPVRLEPQIDGGGQEGGYRSGTLNVPGIVGFGRAVEICLDEMPQESQRLGALREQLYEDLKAESLDMTLNGPSLATAALRLAGNLSVSFADVDGEALMMSMRQLAVSSGSACTSADPQPSHVLRALGIDDDRVRASLRFGLGRFNTPEEVGFAVKTVADAVRKLRKMSSLT